MKRAAAGFLAVIFFCAAAAGWHMLPQDELDGREKGEPEQLYDSDVNYMNAMIRCASFGDMDTLREITEIRNAKIQDLGIDQELLTAEGFLSQYEDYAGFSLGENYLSQMASACVSGDIDAGIEAECKRNQKISALGLRVEQVSFEDLYLLSKVIAVEAGSDWLSMEWKMMVGEVLLNRVASAEFPSTISECIYQEGQYYSRGDERFSTLNPDAKSVEAAARLLAGERVINDPSVVFQGNFRQGSGVYRKMTDSVLGDTYFCYSNYPELYQS